MSKTLMYVLAFILLILILFVPFFTNIVHVLLRILAPFLLASFISYLLYPVYLELQRHGWPDTSAILLLLSVTMVIFGLIVYQIYTLFMAQFLEIKLYLLHYVDLSSAWMEKVERTMATYPPLFHDFYVQVVQTIQFQSKEKATQVITQLHHSLQFVIFLTIVPLISFYMMKDFTRWKEKIRKKYDPARSKRIDAFLYRLEVRVGSYVKGQLVLSIFITLISFLIYSILKIDYALLFAILIGILNVIPFFGPIIGAIPVIFISLQTSWKLAILVTFLMIMIQVVENSFLSPYILGKSINLHPIMIFLLLIIGAEIAGIIGMMVIIPIYLTIDAFKAVPF